MSHRGRGGGCVSGCGFTGGLDNLEVELEQAREGWASREEEMRESCARRLAEVQGKTYV